MGRNTSSKRRKSGSSTFKLPGTWTGLYTVTDTSDPTLADSNELLLNTNNINICRYVSKWWKYFHKNYRD